MSASFSVIKFFALDTNQSKEQKILHLIWWTVTLNLISIDYQNNRFDGYIINKQPNFYIQISSFEYIFPTNNSYCIEDQWQQDRNKNSKEFNLSRLFIISQHSVICFWV